MGHWPLMAGLLYMIQATAKMDVSERAPPKTKCKDHPTTLY